MTGTQAHQRTITAAAITLLITASAFDAARDALIGKAGWWVWHEVKWLAFFPPLAWIWWRELKSWTQRIVAPVVCYIAWVFIYDILTTQ